jgi:PAS domain-containing protein
MRALLETGEEQIRAVVEAAQGGDKALFEALEALPAPLYVTDADGVVTYFNQPCVKFAGRTPAVGKDHWCVTWKLYTNEGEFLPHGECPMAIAVRTQRPVRGVTAVAERPDGTRVNFMPFPTPLFRPTGEFAGAVNMLVDVTDVRQIAEFRSQAHRCRRLACDVGNRAVADTLAAMAAEYDAKADLLEEGR